MAAPFFSLAARARATSSLTSLRLALAGKPRLGLAGSARPARRLRPASAGSGAERALIVTGALALLGTLLALGSSPGKLGALRTLYGGQLWVWVAGPVAILSALTMVSLVWRVALWLRYRPLAPIAADEASLPGLTVVIPAYNEGEAVFHTIRSLLASDYPADRLHICCVDDGSSDDTLAWARAGVRLAPERVTVVAQARNAGKRHALYAGFERVRTPFVVTVDSDTVVLRDTLRALVTPMVVDASVGAVAGRIDVLNRDVNLITRMLAVRYRIGFDFARAYQSELGSVFVTPGALSCYRVDVVRPQWQAWRDVRFLGAPCSNGDDHHMANRVLWAGFRTRYQSNAVARTQVPETYRRLSLMYLRWARSNLRESTLYMARVPQLLRSWRSWPAVVDAIVAYVQIPLRLYLVFVGWALLVWQPALVGSAVTAALLFALLHAAIYLRSERSWDAVYTLAYAVFALFALQWIQPAALLTVRQSRWLTR